MQEGSEMRIDEHIHIRYRVVVADIAVDHIGFAVAGIAADTAADTATGMTDMLAVVVENLLLAAEYPIAGRTAAVAATAIVGPGMAGGMHLVSEGQEVDCRATNEVAVLVAVVAEGIAVARGM